ncbi:MAG: hypothetical protein H7276_11420 [Caulobacter sp.]|nr:hypothetical protein [Vitreoscilla sp.]
MPTWYFLPLLALLLASGHAHSASAEAPHPTSASAASGAAGTIAATCPGRAASSPQGAGQPSSKLRHMPAEGDPCASSFGPGTPLRRLAPVSAGG